MPGFTPVTVVGAVATDSANGPNAFNNLATQIETNQARLNGALASYSNDYASAPVTGVNLVQGTFTYWNNTGASYGRIVGPFAYVYLNLQLSGINVVDSTGYGAISYYGDMCVLTPSFRPPVDMYFTACAPYPCSGMCRTDGIVMLKSVNQRGGSIPAGSYVGVSLMTRTG